MNQRRPLSLNSDLLFYVLQWSLSLPTKQNHSEMEPLKSSEWWFRAASSRVGDKLSFICIEKHISSHAGVNMETITFLQGEKKKNYFCCNFSVQLRQTKTEEQIYKKVLDWKRRDINQTISTIGLYISADIILQGPRLVTMGFKNILPALKKSVLLTLTIPKS